MSVEMRHSAIHYRGVISDGTERLNVGTVDFLWWYYGKKKTAMDRFSATLLSRSLPLVATFQVAACDK